MGQREGLSAEAKRPEGLQLEFRRAPILLVYVMYISSVLKIYSTFPKKKNVSSPRHPSAFEESGNFPLPHHHHLQRV